MSNPNPFTPNTRTYSKRNFVELLELITPGIYEEEDLALSGKELNPVSEIINTNLVAADNISTVLSISAVADSQTKNLDNISGISQYFVKQNKLTNINPYTFDQKILLPLSASINKFDTSSDFNDYLSGTLLPMIIVASNTLPGSIEENISELSSYTGNSDGGSIHNYLVDALGWFYFLNTSAQGSLDWEPSGYVLSSLNSLYLGDSLDTGDGVRGFENFLWRNYSTCTTFSNLGLIPPSFVSGAADAILSPSAGVVATYTSGVQKLENLLTLIDVIYSPLFIDEQDFRVKDAFDDYIGATTQLDDRISKGPLRKFQTAMGFSLADFTDEVENIGLIYDIENTKPEHLRYLADLIGWKLWGGSTDKWRQQLRQAVNVYKRKGTLDSVQFAVNNLITDSVLNVSGNVQELWESYIPHLIWYSLGTESPYFKSLETWTPGLAVDAGVYYYNTSSLEENLKIVTDSLMLELYKKFPDNFNFHGEKFPVNKLYNINEFGDRTDLYTVVNEFGMQPFHIHLPEDPSYTYYRAQAYSDGRGTEWEASHSNGVLGYGVYMTGDGHPGEPEDIHYLSATGDLEFFFNYRGRMNCPLPPFEEIKYYADCSLTPQLVAYLRERLECFGVRPSFASSVQNFIVSAGITTDTNLGSLNEFLMFFSSVQTPPNYNDVLLNISEQSNNILGLWNGKSSHLFLDFDDIDFNFAKTSFEGDSKFALYEAARIARQFTPAHSIVKVNVNASATDLFDYSSTTWNYLGYSTSSNNLRSYGSQSNPSGLGFLGGFELSGVNMGNVGTNDGRGGLNTFVRSEVDNIFDDLLDSKTTFTLGQVAAGNTARRATRRRNFRYALPMEGYYDRTAFNAPNSWDASSLENSMPSSLGELTLGYVASANKFFPIVDPINPSGVWHYCEGLESSRTFSGVPTSATFPYRGLRNLGSNAKWDEFDSATDRYVDRGQTPSIYISMHKLFEDKAMFTANQDITTSSANAYWKNEIQSYANSAIASGLVLNSFEDYRDFKFGTGLHKVFKDYKTYFPTPLGLTQIDKTGGNIFAHVFGKGLYNCDLELEGSAVETMAGDYVASSVDTGLAISQNHGSGVFSTCAVGGYHGDQAVPASGTYIASGLTDSVVPLDGIEFVSGAANNAEYRNPHLLSGIEFCDTSGAPSGNAFYVFRIDNKYKAAGEENYLIGNPIIKCKTFGGLPRLRFDLATYGEDRNYNNHFIKDHKFKLKIKALVAEENSPILGGGRVGIWIHTKPRTFASDLGSTGAALSGLMWSFTSKGKWVMHDCHQTSKADVMSYSHLFEFPIKQPDPQSEIICLGNITTGSDDIINNVSLNNIKEKYFETFEVNFDTRNYTIYNNYEYLDIIPVPEEYYKLKELVNNDDTDYVVEIYFPQNPVTAKYLLIDNISLEDSTLRDRAGIGTGVGIKTDGIPLRTFVSEEAEDKLYFDKDQLRDTLRFFTGLAGVKEMGEYTTNIVTRNAVAAAIGPTNGENKGGSRLNYRLHPRWGEYTVQAGSQCYTLIQTDN